MKKLLVGAAAGAVMLGAFVFPAFAKSSNANGPAPKVDLCHREDETGLYHLINVSENAKPAHLAHGDGLPGELVPGTNNERFGLDCVVNIGSFSASDSLYYNGPTDAAPLYGTGAISFTWDPLTGNVIGGNYDEVVPPTTGTTYYNVITGGTVIGGVVNLTFSRTVPNVYGPFTFTGTLVGNVLTGQLDGPYLFTATGL